MKVTRFFAPLLLLAVTASASFAGTINLSWNPCAPSPIDHANPGGGALDFYAMLTNQSVISQSNEVKIVGGTPGAAMPDAWRFDPTGCEGDPFWTIVYSPPSALAKTCPAIQGAVANIQIKAFQFDATNGKIQIVSANLYPNNTLGNPASGDPSKQYFLGDFHLDFTFGVPGPSDPVAGTCGGVLAPVCLAIYQTDFIDTSGNQVDYVRGQDYLTVNDPNNGSHCPGATPAVSKTWGQLKNQYR
jgi:hypothetical protein